MEGLARIAGDASLLGSIESRPLGVDVRGNGGRKDARGGRRPAECELNCGTESELLRDTPSLAEGAVWTPVGLPRRRFLGVGSGSEVSVLDARRFDTALVVIRLSMLGELVVCTEDGAGSSVDPLVSQEKGRATIVRSESTILWLRRRGCRVGGLS